MKKIPVLVLTFTSSLVTSALAEEFTSTHNEQTDLQVTIYSSNLALIKDKRRLTLPLGINNLAFEGVSASIKPKTVMLSAKDTILLEQNFEYDLLSPAALLNKFVGKKVTLERVENDKLISEEAQVLANNQGTVLKIGDEIRTHNSTNNIVFNEVPANLRDKPTLTMTVDSKSAEQQNVSLSYLTDNLSWNADYVVALDKDNTLDIQAWVTLNNNSGTTYTDAQLQLVAGEINRVNDNRHAMAFTGAASMDMQKARAPNMQQEALFEYHLYTLDRKTTIKNKQQKQVSLFEASEVPYEKQLVIM